MRKGLVGITGIYQSSPDVPSIIAANAGDLARFISDTGKKNVLNKTKKGNVSKPLNLNRRLIKQPN